MDAEERAKAREEMAKKTGVASGSDEPGLFGFMRNPDSEETVSDEEKALIK